MPRNKKFLSSHSHTRGGSFYKSKGIPQAGAYGSGMNSFSSYRDSPDEELDPSQRPAGQWKDLIQEQLHHSLQKNHITEQEYSVNKNYMTEKRSGAYAQEFEEPQFDVEGLKKELSKEVENHVQDLIGQVSERISQMVDEMATRQREERPTQQPMVPLRDTTSTTPSMMEQPRSMEMQKPDYSVNTRPSANRWQKPEELAEQRSGMGQPKPVATTSQVDWESFRRPPSPSAPPRELENSTSPKEPQEISEKVRFLEKELLAAYSREKKLAEDLDGIKKTLENNKQGVSEELENLKKEVKPQPQEASGFSSISAELSEVVKAMNSLVETHQDVEPEIPKKEDAPAKKASETASETVEKSKAEPNAKEKEVTKKKEESEEKPIGFLGKKKMIIIAVAGLILLGGLGFGIMKFMGGSADIDPALMQEYLPEGTQPQETSSEPTSDASTNDSAGGDQATATPEPKVQGTSTEAEERKKAAFADISYAETRWETHKDPAFNLQFDYPVNSTSLVRTDMSLTVIRKTGYIFKIQKVESALELEEYWRQIKARSLNYKAQTTTFREYPAIFLELEDITDYPGDRYLVKRDDVIYDIWYATASRNLDDDDAKRVDVMLNSLDFLDPNA